MVNTQVADENLVPNPPIQVMTSSPEAVCLCSKESLHLNKPSTLPVALNAPLCATKVGLIYLWAWSVHPSVCLSARFKTNNKQ